jgi:predicted Zn-dependent protease
VSAGAPLVAGAAGLPPAGDVVERALAAAGGEPCIVMVEEVSEAEVRFANNTVTTNGERRDRRVTVVRLAPVAGGVASGMARRGGDVDVEDLVAAAAADARAAPAAEDAKPLVALGDPVAPAGGGSGFDDGPAVTDLAVLHGVLRDLGEAFRRARRPGSDRVLAGFAEHRAATVYLGTSTGLRLRHVQPTGALHLVVRAADGSHSAWAGTGTADFAGVSVEALEERVVTRLGQARRRVELPAGRYEVVLPPEAVADLMVGLAEAMGGQDAEDGRTVFSRPGGGTRVGDVLSALPVELRSDPAEPGLTCSPFLAAAASGSDVSVFDNGMAVGRTRWIEEGRLARLRYHRAGAARSGVAATPPVDNLVLEVDGATGSVDDLVARTGRGLLVTCLWYIREVDPATLLLTGLTRDGVYVVEDGEIVGSTNNFRFNESPASLLARTTESGGSERALGREFGDWLNRTSMPALRVPDFNMSSVSQAT